MSGLTRRFFLGSTVAGLASIGISNADATVATGTRFPFGLQLYSVDAELQRDFLGTLRAVHSIGYRQVELVGYYGRTPTQLRRALANTRLHCESIHIRPQQSVPGLPTLEHDPDVHFKMCRALGMRYVVCPGPWMPERIMRDFPTTGVTKADVVSAVARFTRQDWQRSAELLNNAGRRAREFGLQFLYHNGNFEFICVGDSTGYDVILEETDPQFVKLEIDCGWVMAAGYDPVAYLQRERSRVPLIHIKDMNATVPNIAMNLNSTEIGTGIVNWRRLLGVARSVGVRRAFAEQEAPFTHAPLESARLNYLFLDHLRI